MRIFGLVVAGILVHGIAWAQEPGANPNPNVEHRGYSTFEHYCASCHGLDARGDGPVAASLKRKPRDLTRLAEEYGSPLKKVELIELIDGRLTPRAHGTSDMPVWGKRLYEGIEDRTTEATRRGTIFVIIDYLDSIQAKTTTHPAGPNERASAP